MLRIAFIECASHHKVPDHKVLASFEAVRCVTLARQSVYKGFTHFLISQTSSLLFVNLLRAHHSALRLIHASLFSSGERERKLKQNLTSSSFGWQAATCPSRYQERNCELIPLQFRNVSKTPMQLGMSSGVGCNFRNRAFSSSKTRPASTELTAIFAGFGHP